MQIRGLLRNPRFTRPAIITVALATVLVVLNVFVIGGDEFFADRNSIIPPLAALATAFIFFRASAVRKDPVSRRIWLGMGLGFGLYGLADTIWACYSVILRMTVPFPSIADGIWTVGYIPLYYALFTRYRSLRVSLRWRHRFIIAAIALACFLITTALVFRPILADFDPQRALEGFFNIIYPLGDLGLVILSCLILALLREGRFAVGWRLIVGGIFMMTLSDLLFSYATWHNLYYPGGRVNLMTILVDTTYFLAYIQSACGICLYRLVWDIKESFTLNLEFAPSARYYAFVGTNAEHKIITASDNFYCLVNARRDSSYYKMPLAESLGITPGVLESLVARITSQGLVGNLPLQLTTLDRRPRDAWITAVAINDPEGHFTGANIVLTADLTVPEALRLPKNQELVGMVNYLLAQAGSRPKDESQAMRAYFLESIRLLSSMLFQFGGAQFKDALFGDLERTIQQQRLRIELKENAITIPEDCEGDALASLLSPLLETARRYVSEMVGEQYVEEEIGDLEKHLSPTIIRDLDKYQLRAFHLPA